MSTPTPTATSKRRLALIDQMAAEWRSVGRSPAAVRTLRRIAHGDDALARLVLGGPGESPPCRTPCDVLEHMRGAGAAGRVQREEAARLVRVLLREAADPFVGRMLVQALVPGLVSVAGKLQWGRGGDWQHGDEFFAELLSTTWVVVQEWAGQDRPYAVLDLLSAIRCRLRRQLFRAKDLAAQTVPIGTHGVRAAPNETGLEELARALIDLHVEGMRQDEIRVLYAHYVLGYSIAELSVLTGRDRRALYSRRDRGRRRLCA
jgi:hypothetical protein